MAPMNSWQSGVSIGDRFSKAINLASNSILAYPNTEWQSVAIQAIDLEKKAFLQSPDKQSYDHAMSGKISEMHKRRQGFVPELQNQLTNDAARQAQIQAVQQRQHQQMMMNQMAARGMGNPAHPGLQAMQNSGMPGVPAMGHQPQPMGMGMAGPGMLQGRPDQRQFQMQQMAQGRPQPVFHADPLARLSPQDRPKVNDFAMRLMSQADENQKNQIRQVMQQKLTPAQLQECNAQRKDIVFIWYQNTALTQLQARAAAAQRNMMQVQQQRQQAGLPPNAVPQASLQGQMNPGLIGALAQQQAMQDGQMFTPNVENIRSEQQIGLLAQAAGQMVVPASAAPGRNPTPGPIAGLPPQPTPGSQPGPNQTPRPPQVPQPFGVPQVPMDPAAAQVQGQPGVRGVPGRAMPGQPGTLATPNAPPQPSQSPAMNTLNAPMRQPPIPMGGQANGQAMGQGNPPMTAPLNPHFNHQNNTRPPSLPGNMNNPAMAAMVQNLNPEARAAMGGLPENAAMREFYAKLQNPNFQGPKPGMMPGVPGQIPGAAMAAANQAALMNANQKANGAMQPGAQQPTIQQQQQLAAAEREQLMAIIQSPQGQAAMNSMDMPAQIMVRMRGIIPPEIRKWAQLKQYIQNNPTAINQQMQAQLTSYQIIQFKAILDKKKAGPMGPGAGPQPPNGPVVPQPPQQGGFPPPQLPHGFSYPSVLAHVTRQELENTRQRDPRCQGMTDEALTELLRKVKRDSYAKKAWEQYRQSQQPRAVSVNNGNNNLTAGMQKPGMQVPPTPTGLPAGMNQMPQLPHGPQGIQHPAGPPKHASALMGEVPAGPVMGAAKPPVRAPPNPSPATMAKNLKRPNPDDAGDVSAPQANAVPRPVPQPGQPQGAGPKPTMEQLMKLTPEQLAKFSPEQLAKLPADQKQYVMVNRSNKTNETVDRLRELASDAQRLAVQEAQRDKALALSQAELAETRAKLAKAVERIQQLRGNIAKWYHLTKDDSRARMFFKTRFKVSRQFVDGESMTSPRDVFTISKDELDQYINMIDSMLQDIGVLKRTVSQDGPAAGLQAEAQRPPQPSPLSAANLEKQTQALKQAQAHNRAVGKQTQPPAAPTTTQAPFHFGAQKSPAGNPEYYGEQRITQANLVIPPARKKVKTGTGQASPPAPQPQQVPGPSTSPQVNAPSPVAVKKPEPPKFLCLEAGCDMNAAGFPNQDALAAHHREEHVEPFKNPQAFVQEQMSAAFGLDLQGNPKATAKPANAQGVPTPTAAAMAASRSKQGQIPGAVPMSRGASMQRQGSAAAKTPQMTMAAEDPWAGSTVDPADLFSGLGRSMEMVSGGFVPDFGTYRSLTPNDTPESSKDSGVSEGTSDIAEHMALDIDLAVQPLDSDLLWDMDNISMDPLDAGLAAIAAGGEVDMDMFLNDPMMFSLDEMHNTDFSKPWKVDQSLYSGLDM